MVQMVAESLNCRPPGGNVRLTTPVPEYAYFAEHVRQSAIADAVAQQSTAYLLRKRVDGLVGTPTHPRRRVRSFPFALLGKIVTLPSALSLAKIRIMFAFYADILKVKRIIYPKFLKRQGTRSCFY